MTQGTWKGNTVAVKVLDHQCSPAMKPMLGSGGFMTHQSGSTAPPSLMATADGNRSFKWDKEGDPLEAVLSMDLNHPNVMKTHRIVTVHKRQVGVLASSPMQTLSGATDYLFLVCKPCSFSLLATRCHADTRHCECAQMPGGYVG